MILAINVGNTETVLGLFHEHELLAHWRYATAPERTVDELGLLVRGLLREAGYNAGDTEAAVIASVVPPVTPALVQMCRQYLNADTLVINATIPLPIQLAVDEPLTVGADRIANTLAASVLYQRDTIAVDLGTATTFDCISAEGVFLGGIISPGVHTGAETLVRRTAKLPRIDLEKPAAVIGKRTETALRSGIFYGAVEAINGIVRRIQEEWGRKAFVVATGGLAPLIGPHCVTVDHVEAHLTLFGLEHAWRYVSDAGQHPEMG